MIMNLKQMLEETARRYGTKTAIVLGERRLSYTELDETSNKVANALIKMGVGKGDRVIIILPDTLEFIITIFGIVKSGGITIRLNPRSKVEELASFFDDCQPKVLVTESSVLETLMPALPKFKSIEKIIDLSSRYHEGQFVSYQEIMTTGSSQRVEAEPEPGDTADIAYTSGTTGRPKGIVLSHHTLTMGATLAAEGFRQTDKDVTMLFALPLYHMFALVVVLLMSICKGSTIVMVPGLSISSLAEAIEREKGRELPRNQAGEIILRGCLMDGYYNNPQATAEVIKDGWYYTGDIGKIDEDSYVFILGRKKDMIIVSGHNVYPVDVEDVLHTHPKVVEAAVIGVPDKTRGEAIKAFISLKKGE